MNASHHPATPPNRTAPLALWRVAGAFMHLLYALFGAPEDVAARHTLTAQPHRLLCAWLRAGEALMRRLLLIEAAAHAKPNTRPLLRAPRQRVRKLMGFDADAPEKWRVRFRCFLGAPAPRRRRSCGLMKTRRRGAGAPSFHSAWPAAERYEALLRIFNDPAAAARRLARRLHATPHRRVELLHAPPGACDLIGARSFRKLERAARRAFNTS